MYTCLRKRVFSILLGSRLARDCVREIIILFVAKAPTCPMLCNIHRFHNVSCFYHQTSLGGLCIDVLYSLSSQAVREFGRDMRAISFCIVKKRKNVARVQIRACCYRQASLTVVSVMVILSESGWLCESRCCFVRDAGVYGGLYI